MTNIGIIGFGQWPKQAYAPLLAEIPSCRVVAVAARSHTTRELANQTFDTGAKTFANYHELLNDDLVDAVLIALPNSLHEEVLQAASTSKKHLFFEPPVAENPEAAVRVLDALAISGRVMQADAIQASVVGDYHCNGTLMDHGWASLVYAGGQIGQFEFNLVVPQETIIELTVACRSGELVADLQTGRWRWRGEAGDWYHEHTPASTPTCGFVGMRESLQGFFETIHARGRPRANIDVMRRVQRAAQLCVDVERN